MRKLMWFAIGFGAVCALCAYFWLTQGLWIPALVLAVLFVTTAVLSRRVKWLRCVAAVCLGCAAGFLWFQLYASNYLSLAAELDGKIADTTAYCTDYSYQTDYGTAVEGVLYLEGKPFRAKFYVSGDIAMEPGDVLRGAFEFRVTTPDGADEPTAHQGKGIFLLAYQEEDAELLKLAQTWAWAYPAKLRHKLLETLDACFPEDAAAFAKALLLGDRTGIDYETNTAFKLSGISHIIAVSGLHVTILFTLINMLCFKRRWLVALLGIPSLILFAAMAGFSPSITRACIMQCLMIVAMLAGKEYDGPTELAFSCLVMLMANPLVITSVSFQLSVGCIIGMLPFRARICDYLTGKLITKKRKRFVKLKRWFANSIAATLSATVMTTPLVAVHFGAVSLVGVLTNLLTLWVISFIFYGVMLVCLLGAFWPAVGTAAAAVVAWPIRYVLTVSKTLAAFPLSAVYTVSIYIVAWLIFCYILLAVFMFSRKKKPALLACCAVIGLCLALGASWLEPLTDDCRMTVLDVGQGQCILLQSEGKTYLVDCGGSDDEEAADAAAERLLSQGVFRLDGVILTHYDTDHSGGMKYLLSRIPADTLFVPDSEDENGVLAALEPLAGQVISVHDDLMLTYGGTELSIYGPVVPDSGNESSLAILFRHENCDILITGDRSAFGERMLLKTAAIPEVDILVAGHHGSKYSTGTDLLEAVKPKIAVISVGENYYGHPAQEVLDRLAAIGCTVYRTDIHGNIVLRR